MCLNSHAQLLHALVKEDTRSDQPGLSSGRCPLGATSVLVVSAQPTAAAVGELLRRAWGGGLVVAHVDQVAAAVAEVRARPHDAVVLCGSAEDLRERVRCLHAADPCAPIVVVSSKPDAEVVSELIASGAQDVLALGELSASRLEQALRCAILRKRLEADLVRRALHDPLTGLPNRSLFADRLSLALDRLQRNDGLIAVVWADLDDFKLVNDAHGHAAGDAVLVALLAERVTAAGEQPIAVADGHVRVSLSVGMATATDSRIPPEALLHQADLDMYRAKRGRQGHVGAAAAMARVSVGRF
jgi:GGDEF domain-containing protein